MKEGRDNNKLIMEEDTHKIYFSFLLYLYTSTVFTDNFTLDEMVELLFLANRYFVIQLKSICEKRIHHQFLNIRTCLSLYDVCIAAFLYYSIAII
jgi:hypothetical protein